MRLHFSSKVCALFVALFLVASGSTAETPHKGWPEGDQINAFRYDGKISLVRLIASPEQSAECFIATVGFMRGKTLYLSSCDATHDVWSNALGLKIKRGTELQAHRKNGLVTFKYSGDWNDLIEFEDKYIYVEGLFKSDSSNPDGCPNGHILVSRIVEQGEWDPPRMSRPWNKRQMEEIQKRELEVEKRNASRNAPKH